MLGGFVSTIRGEWKAWKKAFKGLPDNPLAKYFALMRKRRFAKLPWYRRNAILILGGIAAAFFLLYSWIAWGNYYSSQSNLTPGQETVQVLLDVAGGVTGLISALVYFWLLQTLFGSLYASLAFLGLPGRRDSSERTDDLLGVSTLTDREFGVAVISHNFGLLIRPIVTLTVVNQVYSILLAATMDFRSMGFVSPGIPHMYDSQGYTAWGLHEEILQVLLELPAWKLKLVTLPLDTMYSLVASLLGALLIIGIFVVLGRSLRHSAAIPATVALAIIWIITSGYVGSYGSIMSTSAYYLSFSEQIQMLGIGCLVVPGLCFVVMRVSLRKPAFGAGLVLIMALLFLPLILTVVITVFGFMGSTSFYSGSQPDLYGLVPVVNEIFLGTLVFSPLNHSGVMSGPDWRWVFNSVANFPWHELLRAPILILVQLLTLAGLAPILLKAISLRRQGQG